MRCIFREKVIKINLRKRRNSASVSWNHLKVVIETFKNIMHTGKKCWIHPVLNKFSRVMTLIRKVPRLIKMFGNHKIFGLKYPP